MRTQTRRTPPQRRVRPTGHPGAHAPHAGPARALPGELPLAFHVFAVLLGVLYMLAAGVLLCLPVACLWSPGEMEAMVNGVADGALQDVPISGESPLMWAVSYLKSLGIEPSRARWKPSGVDYGNTDMPMRDPGRRVTMAWDNLPKSLDAVPPGVNVVAPTWFFVESDGAGSATVNDLGHAGGKTTAWNPVQYVSTAHAGGAQVWAVVQSFKPALTKFIVTDAVCRSKFISSIAGWVQQYDLDGIDIDFENMDPADEEEFTGFIADCKQALPANAVVSVVVTVPLDIPTPGNWWQSYDRAGLGKVADYVAVMAYDKMDLKPLAGIGWVSGRLDALLRQVPAEKLLLGVPFYGEDFTTQLKPGAALIALPASLGKSKSSLEITPAVVQALLGRGYYSTSKGKKISVASWIEKGVWSEADGMDRYSFVDGDGYLHVLYCDDELSLKAKGGLASFDRLAGVAVWEMGYGTDPMWKALSTGMAQTN